METSCTCSCGRHEALLDASACVGAVDLEQYALESYAESDAASSCFEGSDEEDALQLEVRALRRYKSNYELLCGELGELNAQISLQLQRHEADVAALQATIADLQTDKLALEARVEEVQQALHVQREVAKQDQDYSDNVHHQLSTAAELLKATEGRLEEQETQFTTEVERLKARLGVCEDERAEHLASVKQLEGEIEILRAQEADAKEEEALRRRREQSKHKKELSSLTVKVRAVSDELEAQRSALRATKKQLAQVQAENDTLRKQLVNVRRDGAHLSDIIDSQRNENDAHAEQLNRVKRAKKQLANQTASLSQEIKQLESELSRANEALAEESSDLQACRAKLAETRNELKRKSQEFDDARSIIANLEAQVEELLSGERERQAKLKAEEREQRASQERRYRTELVRMRELLADNQQRTSESSRGVQKLRRELLGVQKLLHGCKEDRVAPPEPADRWADTMRSSMTRLDTNRVIEQIRAFES